MVEDRLGMIRKRSILMMMSPKMKEPAVSGAQRGKKIILNIGTDK